MARLIQLKQITLTSGDAVDVASGVTAIVGPNNTGKSSLLRELHERIISDSSSWTGRPWKVVGRIELDFSGTVQDQVEELGLLFPRRAPGQYNDGHFTEEHFRLSNGGVLTPTQITHWWGRTDGGLNGLGQYFATYLNAEQRLGLTGSTSSFDLYREQPTGPLQVLYAKRELEAQIAELTKAAFKVGVTVNRYAGSQIHLHSGSVTIAEGISPQPPEYMAELNALPLLSDQGDGMRAFVGMTLSVLTGRSPLVLIDEPEAFLHPPQARMFGQFLASYATSANGVQVVVATHSEDIIAGLTSTPAASGKISIARLTRDGTQNHIAQLPATAVSELYEDPLIKHYDMLNGLFSTGVVLCEADSDCTYYRAVLDLPSQQALTYVREAHFTHAGGKARIARAIKAFAATAVPVAAIFDIDILQNDHEFNALVESAGADASALIPLRNTVVSAVQSRSQVLKRSVVRAEITEVFDRSASIHLSKGEARKIQEAAAPKSGWKDLKNSGSALLSGDALTAYRGLANHLERHGVFIVEQGELERLHPEVPQGNKADWLRSVIDQRTYESSPAIDLLDRVSAYLEAAQTTIEAAPDEAEVLDLTVHG
ncbi:AAA family ATPase [uncultured Microbacterium sp.]|uniref:AAA family ATPase n=1 Tax=uncultured Microbacterium sp. TaxID=191216 RepID=UPI0025DBF41B|nr:AAA family ATPase [uncultured Microbacterium sp.]